MKFQKIIGIIITILFTLFGFLLSIGNDFFSQYDYKLDAILKGMINPPKTVSYEEIKNRSDEVTPMYYFILDVSGSIRQKRDEVLTQDIKDKIQIIKESANCPPNGFDFDITDNSKTIKYKRLLQVHLMYALLKYSNNDEILLWFFSDNPQKNPFTKMSEAFEKIYQEEFIGLNSDFITLINSLRKNILEKISASNIFKRRECHIIIFSDYIHDTKARNSDKKLRETTRNFIETLNSKSVDVKLHYIESAISSDKSPLLGILLEESPSSKVEKWDINRGIISPIISKKPIPFYYSNSLFEEELKTTITFNKTDSFSIGLNSESYDKMKQEYYIIKNDEDTFHLSSNMRNLLINKKDSINLMIRGYIPAPYSSPDLIIHDKGKGVKYVVPVAFYKEFPATGWIIIRTIGIILCCSFIYLLYFIVRTVKKRLHKSSKELQKERSNF